MSHIWQFKKKLYDSFADNLIFAENMLLIFLSKVLSLLVPTNFCFDKLINLSDALFDSTFTLAIIEKKFKSLQTILNY